MFEHFYDKEPQDSLHGLAPSATNKSLSEAKLMSLWSFWARSPQCISLDFTMATEAAKIYNNLYVDMCFLVNTNKILTEKLQYEKQKSSKYYSHWDCVWTWQTLYRMHWMFYRLVPLYLVIIFIQEAGSTFIKEYGINITCMPLNTLWNKQWYR